MNNEIVLVINGQVVFENSKANWPDLNYPNSINSFLRTVHKVNYEELTVQMDDENGPIFTVKTLPERTGFFKKITK